MPCIVDPPQVSEKDYLEHMLCQACQKMTMEQISTIKGIDIYHDLYNWYINHLFEDAHYYRYEYMENETPHSRLGLGALEFLCDDEKEIKRGFEMNRIERELKKLKRVLVINENGISIKPEKS